MYLFAVKFEIIDVLLFFKKEKGSCSCLSHLGKRWDKSMLYVVLVLNLKRVSFEVCIAEIEHGPTVMHRGNMAKENPANRWGQFARKQNGRTCISETLSYLVALNFLKSSAAERPRFYCAVTLVLASNPISHSLKLMYFYLHGANRLCR